MATPDLCPTRGRLAFRVGGWLCVATNVVMLPVACFRPATHEVNIYQKIYHYHHPEPITLYGIRHNPYNLALEVDFYQSPQLTVRELPSLAALDTVSADRYLLITKTASVADSIAGRKTLLYQTFPTWFRSINVNDWQSRTRQYFLYEVER